MTDATNPDLDQLLRNEDGRRLLKDVIDLYDDTMVAHSKASAENSDGSMQLAMFSLGAFCATFQRFMLKHQVGVGWLKARIDALDKAKR